MFVVTEADAAAIRAVFEQRGEIAAAVELRRRFPCVTDNALIPHLRPAFATKGEKSHRLKRAYGKRSQTKHDEYITELANLQSELALKSGDRFCSINSGMFDQVMPLSTVEQLATYAQGKPVQQALAVQECPAEPTPKATPPRKKGQQTASR